MIVDSKGKLFGKVSLIDIVVILVIVGAIAGVAYKFSTSKSVGILQAKDKLEIVFYGEEVPSYAAEQVVAGNICREVVQNALFGTVTDVKVEDSASVAPDDTGIWRKSPKPGYSAVTITIEGEGKYADDGVTIDNSVYFIGKQMELRVGNMLFLGRLKSISKKD